MIRYMKGNILNSNAFIIVNPVNTVGVMGAGLALQLKRKYPKMYKVYKRACQENELDVGKLMLIKVEPYKWILLFPTKKDWRNPSELEYIEAGLKRIHDVNIECDSVMPGFAYAFPKLGCGCGGLDWETQVKPLMEKYLSDLPCICCVYE